jgi:TPP-dependent pyruvate/acetoin dehydrogenase alpha subunit
MAKQGLWNEEYGQEVKSRMTAAIDEAVLAMEAVPPPAMAEMFEQTGATLSSRQAAQLKEL